MKRAEAALKALASPAKARLLMTFFKTGKGEYGEGDRFLGVTVPEIRKLVKRFGDLPLGDCERLLRSPYNEVRLFALLVMVAQYEKGGAREREGIYRAYLRNARRVNNWNLVDASAHRIVGAHVLERDRGILYKLAKSKDLWERRIAIVATWTLIQNGYYSDTLKLSFIYLKDTQDLMHKACGWMLREVGKRDVAVLEKFLKENHAAMPRTMLRYAIEKFPPARRRKYLAGKV